MSSCLTLIPVNVQAEQPAPVSLPPLLDLGLAPLTDTPEATFEMIAAANLQPEAAQEPASDPDPDLEDEESAEALEPHSELEDDVDLGPAESEVEEEEILLAEVFYFYLIEPSFIH